MNANVKVLSVEDYAAWYADSSTVITEAKAAAPGSEGLKIMIDQGCNACHSSDGTKIVGPSYLNLFGEKQVVIRDGKEVTITVDEEYIKRAVYEPNSDIVKGYPKDLMQSYKDVITADDLVKIVEYLKSLNDK
jgi:cytochrome c oxidase subunit 2